MPSIAGLGDLVYARQAMRGPSRSADLNLIRLLSAVTPMKGIPMALWVVRGGRGGSYAQWCLAEGRAAAAWNNVPTLVHAQSRDDVVALVAPTMPNESTAKVGNLASQLWGLRSIEPGDTVILPLSSSGTLAVGVCTGGYEHLDEHAPARHSVRVDWRADEVPRAVLGQDLLYSLGSLLTVFQLSRHNAEARFAEVLRTGVDPDASTDDPDETPSASVTTASGTLLDPEPVPTIESIRDRVRTHIRTHFREHDLDASGCGCAGGPWVSL